MRKATVPADDPGKFNLLLNGRVVATGGNGTTTGPMIVGVGEGTVSETGAARTDLGDYDSRVDCTRNGQPVLTVEGTKVDGAIAQGDVVVCTFTNTRKSAPPTTPTTRRRRRPRHRRRRHDDADHATDDADDHDHADDADDHATDHATDHSDPATPPTTTPRPRPRPLRSLRPRHRIQLRRRSAISS